MRRARYRPWAQGWAELGDLVVDLAPGIMWTAAGAFVALALGLALSDIPSCLFG